jgi:hypothetical protein
MVVDVFAVHSDFEVSWRSALRRAEDDPEYAATLRRYLELVTGMPTELRRFNNMLLPYTSLFDRFYIVVNRYLYFITDRICRSPRRIRLTATSIVAHTAVTLNASEAYFCGNYVAYRTTDLPGYVVDYVGPYYVMQLREATSIPIGDIDADTL